MVVSVISLLEFSSKDNEEENEDYKVCFSPTTIKLTVNGGFRIQRKLDSRTLGKCIESYVMGQEIAENQFMIHQ